MFQIYLIFEWCNSKASLNIFPKGDLKTQYLLDNVFFFIITVVFLLLFFVLNI